MEKRKAKKMVKRWNETYSIGTLVNYRMFRQGEDHVGMTSTDAFFDDSGEPVVYLEERSFPLSLSSVTPLTVKPSKRRKE